MTSFLPLLTLWIFTSAALFAQDNRSPRTIVVGDLVGRTDYRDLKILTQQGPIPITSEGNGKSFSVLRRSPTQVILQFHRSLGLEDFNPNTVVYQFFENERALISALILDEVDVAELENEASAFEVRNSNEHFRPLPIQVQGNKVKLILYNHRLSLFESAQIRQAISYGINHDYIIKKIITGGKATIARGPFDDNSPLYNTGMKAYKYDPRYALSILSQNRWRDSNKDGVIDKDGKPFTFELLYPQGGRIDEDISRIVKIDLAKLGIDVHPRPADRAEINDRLASGNFEAVLLDHVFEDNVQSLIDFFGAQSPLNFTGYHSDTFERYLNFYNSAQDEQHKKTLIRSMQNVINQDQPVTFLYFKWLTHFMVNVKRFEDFRYKEGPNRGQIKPFQEWTLKSVQN